MQIYTEHYEKMLEALNNEEEPHSTSFDVDSTNYPMIINVVNPWKGKYSYTPCRLCGLKNCSNCPMPVSKTMTLR